MALPRIGHQSRVQFHRALLGPVLFIICINDIDVELNNYISKLINEKKIGNSIMDDYDRLSLQKDLKKISDWSEKREMPFNVNKSHILLVSTRNQKYDYEMKGVFSLKKHRTIKVSLIEVTAMIIITSFL